MRRVAAGLITIAAPVWAQLGTMADVPRYIETLKTGTVLEKSNAAQALGDMGLVAKPAVPELIRMLKGGNVYDAALALGEIGPAASDAVPALIAYLKSARQDASSFSETVAWALGSIGPAARPALPLLAELAKNPDITIFDSSCNALKKLGADGVKLCAQALRQHLRNGNENQQWRAVGGLWAIGPEAADSVPDLMEAMKGGSPRLRSFIAPALGGIGHAAKPAVPLLLEALRSYDEHPHVRTPAHRHTHPLRTQQPGDIRSVPRQRRNRRPARQHPDR
jgi:HEAT repeat protein